MKCMKWNEIIQFRLVHSIPFFRRLSLIKKFETIYANWGNEIEAEKVAVSYDAITLNSLFISKIYDPFIEWDETDEISKELFTASSPKITSKNVLKSANGIVKMQFSAFLFVCFDGTESWKSYSVKMQSKCDLLWLHKPL